MKKNIIIAFLSLVILTLCLTAAVGDNTYSTYTAFNGKTFATSGVYTSGTMVVGAWTHISLRVRYSDSVYCAFKIYYRIRGATSWTQVSAVSGDTLHDVAVVHGTATYFQTDVRYNGTDRIPGCSTEWKIVPTFQGSDCSANMGATFDANVEFGR